MGAGAAEALVVLLWLVVPMLVLAGIYRVVRLGVRDGVREGMRDAGTPPAPEA